MATCDTLEKYITDGTIDRLQSIMGWRSEPIVRQTNTYGMSFEQRLHQEWVNCPCNACDHQHGCQVECRSFKRYCDDGKFHEPPAERPVEKVRRVVSIVKKPEPVVGDNPEGFPDFILELQRKLGRR